MPLIQAAITDQAKAVAKGTLVPTNLVMGHGTKVVLASNDQLAKTVGQVGLLGASLNGGPVAGLKAPPRFRQWVLSRQTFPAARRLS